MLHFDEKNNVPCMSRPLSSPSTNVFLMYAISLLPAAAKRRYLLWFDMVNLSIHRTKNSAKLLK